jgi:putative transposase
MLAIIHKRQRYRVYPTAEQAVRLDAWTHALRFLWNLAHEQRLEWMRKPRCERRYPTNYDQSNQVTPLRAELPWLADVPSQLCSTILARLHVAWRQCFGKISRAPRWKKRGDALSMGTSSRWHLVGTTLHFPKLGPIRAVVHRPLEGVAKSCTLLRDGDQWFASIVCEVTIPAPTPRTSPVVAIDRGITVLAATSDGELIANPRFGERSARRLARAQRRVARRKKGSANRAKAALAAEKIHRKIRRQRAHHHHVLSTRIAKSHGVVIVEKLNVAGLKQGSLGRVISDAGWSQLASMLRYKLAWTGGILVEVPAAYSSQTCFACGAIDRASRKGIVFRCTSCGHVDHADLNAAKVLKSRANRSALPGEGAACGRPVNQEI